MITKITYEAATRSMLFEFSDRDDADAFMGTSRDGVGMSRLSTTEVRLLEGPSYRIDASWCISGAPGNERTYFKPVKEGDAPHPGVAGVVFRGETCTGVAPAGAVLATGGPFIPNDFAIGTIDPAGLGERLDLSRTIESDFTIKVRPDECPDCHGKKSILLLDKVVPCKRCATS